MAALSLVAQARRGTARRARLGVTPDKGTARRACLGVTPDKGTARRAPTTTTTRAPFISHTFF